MATGSLDNETVNIVPGNLKMSQDANMAIFRLVEWKLESNGLHESVDKDIKGIHMVVVMKRKITSEMMTTYFPTLLLTAITFATTFFKPFFFEAALSVNLTTMLVMTTIFIGKVESLPPTADLRMIDAWLILCQLVPFIEVVLLTAMEYLRETDSNENAQIEKQKKISKNDYFICALKFVGKCIFQSSLQGGSQTLLYGFHPFKRGYYSPPHRPTPPYKLYMTISLLTVV